jgi:hypothetical protein
VPANLCAEMADAQPTEPAAAQATEPVPEQVEKTESADAREAEPEEQLPDDKRKMYGEILEALEAANPEAKEKNRSYIQGLMRGELESERLKTESLVHQVAALSGVPASTLKGLKLKADKLATYLEVQTAIGSKRAREEAPQDKTPATSKKPAAAKTAPPASKPSTGKEPAKPVEQPSNELDEIFKNVRKVFAQSKGGAAMKSFFGDGAAAADTTGI